MTVNSNICVICHGVNSSTFACRASGLAGSVIDFIFMAVAK